jgi:hypothetical protein
MAASIGADYYLIAYTPLWAVLGIIERFRSLRYVRAVNAPGELRVIVPVVDLDFDRSSLTRDVRIDVYRATPGSQAVLDTSTIWFITSVVYREMTNEVEIIAEAAITLLGRRRILAAPGSAAADKSAAADSLIISYATEALGASASSSRQISTFGVAAAAGTGPTVPYQGSMRTLLKATQDICNAAAQAGTNVYADVVYDDSTSPAMLRLRTYVNVRGTDRGSTSAGTLVFGQERNNLIDATVTDDWRNEVTVVYVLGAGQGSAQTIVAVTSTRTTATPYAWVETSVNAGQTKDVTTLAAVGSSELYKTRPRRVVTGTAMNVDSCQYGVHWFFGDKVIVEVDDISYDARIDSVEINVENGKERIVAKFRAEVLL